MTPSALTAAQTRILKAYAPDEMAAMGRQLTDRLADFLRLSEQSTVKSTPPLAAEKILKMMATELNNLEGRGHESLGSTMDLCLGEAMRLHSPHYMGHQVPPPLPLAALVQSLIGIANQGTAIYEMAPTTIGAEKALIAELLSYIGWEKKSTEATACRPDGILTNGGTLANLTAILTARNVHFGDSWSGGVGTKGGRPSIIVSGDSHYSISRAAGIIGIGTDHVLKCKLDKHRRIDVAALKQMLADAKGAGRNVFAVVAAAGSTPVGAFDDLETIGSVARENKIWFHVDAAHGGGVLLSKTHRHLLAGCNAADSMTWDAHKMMFMPSLSTFLFYRNREHSFKTFAQDAPYLLDHADLEKLDRDAGLRTLECTRQAFALGLWATWRAYGPGIFEDLVDVVFAQTWKLYELILASSDFEAVHQPEANILCFRYIPRALKNSGESDLNRLQVALRGRLNDSGEFYITGTTLDGVACLRVTIMNPRISTEHLQSLLEALRRHAVGLL